MSKHECQYCLVQDEPKAIATQVLEVIWGMITIPFFPFILAWQAYNLKDAPKDELVCYHIKCEHVQIGLVWACGVIFGVLAAIAAISL